MPIKAQTSLKTILASVMATAVVVAGGVLIGFQKQQVMTYEDMQAWIELTNQRLSQKPASLSNVTKDTVVHQINTQILTDITDTTTVNKEVLSSKEYNSLVHSLILKSEQKTSL